MKDNNTGTTACSVKFHGTGREYFSIWLTNILPTIITFGIYSAWATVRRRCYFYGNLEIAGDRFNYHGKAINILLRRIAVIVGLCIVFITMHYSESMGVLLYIFFIALIPFMIVRSWRYNALMSSFRGIHFNFHVSLGAAYWALLIAPVLLTVAFCIIIIPLFAAGQFFEKSFAVITPNLLLVLMASAIVSGVVSAMWNSLCVNNMAFGNVKFSATLSKKKFINLALISHLFFIPGIILVLALAACFFSTITHSVLFYFSNADAVNLINILYLSLILPSCLIIAVSGLLVGVHFSVVTRNYTYNQTFLGKGIKFKSVMRAGYYIRLLLGYGLLIVFTLGLAIPFARVRLFRYLAESTFLEGDLTLAQLKDHNEDAEVAVAEGFTSILDIDITT